MVSSASANNYPYGQCTWWACQRFHDTAGVYVPWAGDAHSWTSLALAYGWSVTSVPVNGPSIICLQPLIQGAGILGHVAYVEAVTGNQVTSSNMNWGDTTAQRYSVQSVNFHTGPGVNFISLPGTKPVQSGQSVNSTSSFNQPVSAISSIGSFLSSYPVIAGWATAPVRIAKLLAGIGCVFLAIALLLMPDIEELGKVAAKAGVMLA